MKRPQKVVVRFKVRKVKRGETRTFLWKVSKMTFAAALMISSTMVVYDLVFQSDTFMVKSVEIMTRNDLTSRLAADLNSIRGHSIFTVSCGKIEADLLGRYPSIRGLRLRREFPDRLSLEFSLREPLAIIRNGEKFQGVDSEGKIFPLTASISNRASRLPEVSAQNPRGISQTVRFIESWNRQSSLGASAGASSLNKVFSDDTGEISAEISDGSSPSATLRLIWGVPGPADFAEKFKRYTEVTANLKERNLTAKSINLRNVPRNGESDLDGRKTVGRVVVSLARNVN